ncbi:MAG: hypothetical protein K9G62_03565 [Alphaproteobacteria bacterium]|nr:hypothetical protein [Alphaproteobacteria bacterium]
MKKGTAYTLFSGIVLSFMMSADVQAQKIQTGKTVSQKLPDERTVTFKCSDLRTNNQGAPYMTGAFVAAADWTPPHQEIQLKNSGQWAQWNANKGGYTAQSGVGMLIHLDSHKPPYKYCTDQVNQIRTGDFKNTGVPCPPVTAFLGCLTK